MPYYRRSKISGATYFFTVVTEHRQRILTNPDIRAALRLAITKTRATQPFQIDAWVLLPDHLHCIWTLPETDNNFSNRWRSIKREVSVICGQHYLKPNLLSMRRIKKNNSTLWQPRFWEHLIRNEQDYENHMNYLHFNPVKHGLVNKVADWPWSSFHRMVSQHIYPEDWGSKNDINIVIPYDD
ncbi:transposase [Iodobacter sp. CM08]|uniref:REP-associated tyrosine transposase n=1 Tax=Iodobacter sp. CM08 TaxID=3085902 RepID=UPI002981CC76|nr:transposase [Iodobacter sp. CM08]MDW5415615.1 transposase [Iodobacter sp. CM08]